MKFKEMCSTFWEGSFANLDFQFILMPIILALVAGGYLTIIMLTASTLHSYNAFWLLPVWFTFFFGFTFTIANSGGCCLI